jgi:integrase
MRQPKPYFKKSHQSWYANIGANKAPVKLAEGRGNETAAWDKYHSLMTDRQPVSADCRVGDLLDRYLDHLKRNRSDATYQYALSALTSFATFVGDRLQVSQVKPHHIHEWIGQRHHLRKAGNKQKQHETNEPTNDTYRHNLIRTVKAAFRWAADEMEYIDRSPVRKVKLPAPRPRDVYLMPDQWDQLAAKVGKAHDKGCLLDYLTVLAETGCRPQEARRVESRHFDRDNRCWTFPVDESKGKRDSRVVLLTDQAFVICQRLALKYPEGPIFRNSDGTPWTRHTIGGRLNRLSGKLGFHVCAYAVRHTFCTNAIIRGVDLQTIASLMGHKDLRMLSRIYQHIQKRSDHMRAGLKKAVGHD